MITDPDPRGPKSHGSGSGTHLNTNLVELLNKFRNILTRLPFESQILILESKSYSSQQGKHFRQFRYSNSAPTHR
jgi:hypothetical protein